MTAQTTDKTKNSAMCQVICKDPGQLPLLQVGTSGSSIASVPAVVRKLDSLCLAAPAAAVAAMGLRWLCRCKKYRGLGCFSQKAHKNERTMLTRYSVHLNVYGNASSEYVKHFSTAVLTEVVLVCTNNVWSSSPFTGLPYGDPGIRPWRLVGKLN